MKQLILLSTDIRFEPDGMVWKDAEDFSHSEYPMLNFDGRVLYDWPEKWTEVEKAMIREWMLNRKGQK